MTYYVKQGGAWVAKNSIAVKQSGSMVTKTSAYKRVNGAWVQFLAQVFLPSNINYSNTGIQANISVGISTAGGDDFNQLGYNNVGFYTWNPNNLPRGNYRFRVIRTSGPAPSGSSLNTLYTADSHPTWSWTNGASSPFVGYMQITDTAGNMLVQCPMNINP